MDLGSSLCLAWLVLLGKKITPTLGWERCEPHIWKFPCIYLIFQAFNCLIATLKIEAICDSCTSTGLFECMT